MKYLIALSATLSFLLIMIGAVFKIQSWEGGDYFLLPGVILFPLALLCVVIVKLVRSTKEKDVLELDDNLLEKPNRTPEKLVADDNELTL